MSSITRGMWAFQRSLPETTRISRRTILELPNRDVRNNINQNKLFEIRDDRRQKAAFARRRIQDTCSTQNTSEVDMEDRVSSPPRRSAGSPRFGTKASWKHASPSRKAFRLTESLRSTINQRNIEAYALLCSLSGQINTTLSSLFQARFDPDDFERVAKSLLALWEAAVPEVKQLVAKCDIPGVVTPPSALQIGWDMSTFESIHTYLYDRGERGDLPHEWYPLLDIFEEFAEKIEYKLKETHRRTAKIGAREVLEMLRNAGLPPKPCTDDGGGLDTPDDDGDIPMPNSLPDVASWVEWMRSVLNQSTSTQGSGFGTSFGAASSTASANTSFPTTSQPAVNGLDAASSNNAMADSTMSSSGVPKPANNVAGTATMGGTTFTPGLQNASTAFPRTTAPGFFAGFSSAGAAAMRDSSAYDDDDDD